MLTKKIVVGIVRTNCYIVALEDRTDCVVIDPGDEAKRILQETDGRQIAAILFTHGHFDHIGAGEDLVTAAGQAGGPKICIHREDEPMLKNGKLNASQVFFRKAILGPKATDLLEDGDTVREAGLTFQVIHTPGHTRGSVCYLCGDLLFTGDTVMRAGFGRTDLPTGSASELMESVRRIGPLLQTHTMLGGHD